MAEVHSFARKLQITQDFEGIQPGQRKTAVIVPMLNSDSLKKFNSKVSGVLLTRSFKRLLTFNCLPESEKIILIRKFCPES